MNEMLKELTETSLLVEYFRKHENAEELRFCVGHMKDLLKAIEWKLDFPDYDYKIDRDRRLYLSERYLGR